MFYACRANTKTKHWFGDEISSKDANTNLSKIKRTSKTKSYPANPWGLYDIYGNVREWCLETDETLVELAKLNGEPAVAGLGGSWYEGAELCARRYGTALLLNACGDALGFRILLESLEQTTEKKYTTNRRRRRS